MNCFVCPKLKCLHASLIEPIGPKSRLSIEDRIHFNEQPIHSQNEIIIIIVLEVLTMYSELISQS